MWTSKNRNTNIKGDQVEVINILNGYEHIDSKPHPNLNPPLRQVERAE